MRQGRLARSWTRNREWWLVGLLTLVAAVLRFATLGSQSLWLDEWLTLNYTDKSLGDTASAFILKEQNPPLYFVGVWLWTKLAGTSEFGLRSLSAVAGTASVPLAYAVARTRFPARPALLAAALVAVGPFSVWYSQEARPYALLELLSLASILCLIRFVDGGDRRWLWGWVVASALALLTHFFAGFLLAGEVLWLLWHKRSRDVLVAIGAVGLAGLLMLALISNGRTGDVAWIHQSDTLSRRLATLPTQFLTALNLNWDTLSDTVVRFLCAAAICAAGLALAVALRRERARAAPFITIAAATILLPLALAVVKPSSDYFLPRYLIAALIPLLIVTSAGLVSRARGLAGGLGIAAGLALVGVLLSMTISIADRPILQRPDWRSAAKAIGPAPTARAVITNVSVQGRPLLLYLDGLTQVYTGGSSVFGADPPEFGQRRLTVSEIVYVTPAVFGSRAGLKPPMPGFRLATRRLAGLFYVLRYTSSKPLHATAAELAATGSRVFGFTLTPKTAPAVYEQQPL